MIFFFFIRLRDTGVVSEACFGDRERARAFSRSSNAQLRSPIMQKVYMSSFFKKYLVLDTGLFFPEQSSHLF